MARHCRFHQDWAVYHVMIRCNNKQMLLKNKSTKLLLLERMGCMQQRLDFKLFGFVIMDNHAHWLIQTQGVNGLSTLMQKVLLSFSRKYRQKNKYVGHFWQGRYKSVSVITDVGMKEVIDYVHKNPLKARIVSDIKDYVFSSAYKYFEFENQAVESLVKVTRYGDTSDGTCDLLRV